MILSHILSTQSSLDRSGERAPGAIEGIIVDGSWNPQQATVQVVVGDTYAATPDSGDQYLPITARLFTPAYGMQYGPQGGERALLFRKQSGWLAMIEHQEDDSPAATKGETLIGALGPLSVVRTKGGHIVTLDDVGKKVEVQTTGGLVIVLDDNTGLLSVGGTGLDSTADAALLKTHGDTLSSNIISTVQAWTKANFQAGSNAAAPNMTAPTATGSAVVKIKP